ncbi:MAG: MBL fold metallo-hydrolase [Acetobacteraceae bacterium]|nr:MBL fold metallo-hydrolase [Acetobacteraceae bacterium]
MLRVTVLGCGGSAGVPQIGGPDGTGDWGACDKTESRNRRTRSSIVLQGEGSERLLVDSSPDMRAQLIACAVPRVDAILFTHAHADHVLGIDDIRILNRIVKRPIEAFAEARTMAELDRRFDYAFGEWTTQPHFFRPVLSRRTIAFGDVVETCGLRLQTFEQDHGFLSTIGFRVGGFGYSTDVVTLDERAFAILEGVDTWIVDCFQRARHKTHANVDQVIAWFEQVKPRRMILTHMGYDIDWSWLQKRLPAGIEPAFDGMLIDSP